MARKPTPVKKPVPAAAPQAIAPQAGAPQAGAARPIASTPVRHTAIPKGTPPARPVITHEMIAKRAFEISCGPHCGSEMDNWFRAERELRG
jgi:hypothetical protein